MQAAEPAPQIVVEPGELPGKLEVFADFADLKSPFMAGHSRAVAELASATASAADRGRLQCAGLVHDLGRVAIPNGVWAKPGPLSQGNWEQVRLHAYYTERVLSRCSALAEFAPVAGMHHERSDGSGDHRGSREAAIPLGARVVAAADAYQAMTEPRPHRPALQRDAAARQLEREAAASRLDRQAVDAILSATGHRRTHGRTEWPAGLTDREVAVLRLICTGHSKKDVAAQLVISHSTADHHVRHIYEKIGVSTRAGATLCTRAPAPLKNRAIARCAPRPARSRLVPNRQRSSALLDRHLERKRRTKPMSMQIMRQTVQANGAQLYTEVRGSGPSVLFIQGGLGDGGFFERVAQLLSDGFTTIIYDRRGNSRSPRPNGWQTTSMDEQADDAAALLSALDLAPAAIYGTSSGAAIGLNLVIRYPDLVRGALLHEPGLMAALPDPHVFIAQVMPIIEQAMARGGPRAAVEAFVRTVGGDAAYERMPADLRERIVNNGELMNIEMPLNEYLPSQTELASISCPVEVLVGTQSPPPLMEMSRWLAAALNAPTRRISAGHAPQLEQPQALAEELRSWLAHLDQLEDTDAQAEP